MEKLLEKIKIIVSEVDGIITEGLISYDELQNVPFKTFYMKDFEAVNEIRKIIPFVFLSSDNSVTYNLMRSKNIPFFWAPKNKKEKLVEIMKRYDVISAEEVLFIGSTYSDTACVKLIPLSLCPQDAVSDVVNLSSHKLASISGMGVLTEVYDLLKNEINRRRQCS